jgi:hypothetical protein
MSDSDYIKAAGRDRMYRCKNLLPDPGPEVVGQWHASHTVADDVMSELAEALRHPTGIHEWCEGDCGRGGSKCYSCGADKGVLPTCDGCLAYDKAQDVLARYDALIGGER